MKKILISACMLGDNVRYDGGHHLIDHPILKRWKQEGRLVPICPEIAGGLEIPRPAAETQCKFPILITTKEGDDVTPQFLTGAEKTLEKAKQERVCCALMKAKSPSCGNQRIYDGNFSGKLIDGAGVAAAELMRNGIPVFNEKQLNDLFAFVEDSERISA
ncbi:MAG: DUF523 domain-containing protein [Neptuniibacter sp.]